MKPSPAQLQRIVEKVFAIWKQHHVVILKADEKAVFARAVKSLQDDLQKEQDVEREANKMLDELERTNPGGFQRHKMYHLLKQKLAKERKVIL